MIHPLIPLLMEENEENEEENDDTTDPTPSDSSKFISYRYLSPLSLLLI